MAMKVGLITTTVNTPTVLALYRKFGPDVHFFVAGDYKTPVEAVEFCAQLGNCQFYSPQDQKDLGYASSELIGWNNDSRRNIALLEAVKWGAEIIVSVDDDMIPNHYGFFNYIEMALEQPFSGLCLGESGHWFNPSLLTVPPVRSRGIPIDIDLHINYSVAVDAKIGVMQGIILGIPDADAIAAITARPFIHSATDILRNGFVAVPDCLTVFNSQLTAFRRELAPAFAQFYKWQGRNTDIFASLIMRRLMQSMGLYTYYGPPMGFHARRPRPLLNDLKSEMYGLEHIVEFSEAINFEFDTASSLVEKLEEMYASLNLLVWWHEDNTHAAMAFLEDIETFL